MPVAVASFGMFCFVKILLQRVVAVALLSVANPWSPARAEDVRRGGRRCSGECSWPRASGRPAAAGDERP